ncbi:MAG: glycosyltransferase family 4 protein [Treponemataceae bacterium]
MNTASNKKNKIIKKNALIETSYAEKINILYDAQVLAGYSQNDAARTGIFTVALNILENFSKYDCLEIYLYATNEILLSIQQFIKFYKKKIPNLKIFTNNSKEIDLYFSTYYKIPQSIRDSNISCFSLVYDIIPILYPDKHHSSDNNSPFKKMIDSWTKNDYFFTISEHTKIDIIKNLNNIDPKKITTTLLAASTNFYVDSDREKNQLIKKKYNIPLDKKYIFSLCTLEPRKNLIFAVKNFINFINKNKIDDLVIVLAGTTWDMFITELENDLITLSSYKDKIIKAGYVDDCHLASLYSHALCTVYVSIYEGFGLPPLEAMQCGCPVITSNSSSLPEVVGDAGLMVDPNNDSELIKAYEKLYFEETFRKKLSIIGIERAKEFSWKKCTDIMIQQFLQIPFSRKAINCNIKENKKLNFNIKYSFLKKIIKKLPVIKLLLERYSNLLQKLEKQSQQLVQQNKLIQIQIEKFTELEKKLEHIIKNTRRVK